MNGCTRRQAAQWLTASRGLAVEVRKLGEMLDELALGTSTRTAATKTKVSRGQAIRDQYSVISQTSAQVNDIARGLFDATARGDVVIPEALGAMITSTGAALEVHASALSTMIADGGDPPTGVLRALDAVVEGRSKSVANLKTVDDTGALLLGGSILTEVDRMVHQLGGKSDS